MKKVKYLLGCLLLMTAFVFNGEMYILYLESFQDGFYQSSFSFDAVDPSKTDDRMIQDFKKVSEQTDVHFFLVNRTIESAYSSKISLYGSPKAFEAIESKGVKEGTYKSLFMGRVEVHFEPLERLTHLEKYSEVYYIGDDSNYMAFREFKKALIHEYGGGFPQKNNDENGLWMNLLTVWLIVFILMLLINMYHVMDKRKEIAVRAVLGDDLERLFLKECLLDTMVYSALFGTLYKGLYVVTTTHFKIWPMTGMFILFLCLNMVVNALALNVSFKKHLSIQTKPMGVFGVHYGMKIIFTMMALLILSGNVLILLEGVNLYHQKDFFEKHKRYAYYNLSYKSYTSKEKYDYKAMNEAFYMDFHNQSLQYTDYTKNLSHVYPILFVNRPAMVALFDEYPFLKALSEGSQFAILAPEDVRGNPAVDAFIDEAYRVRFTVYGDQPPEPIYYNEKLTLVGIDNDSGYHSKRYNEPIVFYYDSEQGTSLLPQLDFRTKSILFDITDENFEAFIKMHHLENEITSKSNVYEVFKEQWAITFRHVRLLSILSAMIVCLILSLDVVILKMSYRYNSIELSLKKIHGYTLIERHQPLFLTTFFSTVISVALTWLIFTFGIRRIEYRTVVFIIGLILMVIESGFVFLKVCDMERKSMVSILKGEKI